MTNNKQVIEKSILDLALTDVGFLAVNKENNILYKNEKFNKLWGIPNYDNNFDLINSIINKQIRKSDKIDLKYPKDKETLKSEKILYLNNGRVIKMTHRLLYDKNTQSMIWVFRDDTEKFGEEKKYSQNEILNALTEPAYITDSKGNLLDYNERFVKYFNGIDIINKNIWKLFDKEAKEKLLKSDKILIENELENISLNIKKDEKTIKVKKSVINKKEEISILNIFSDISIQKNLVKKLYESRQRYRKLYENSPDAVYILEYGKIIGANKKGLELLNISDYLDIKEDSLLKYIHPDYHSTYKKEYKKLIENKDSTPLYEAKVLTTQGNIKDVEVKFSVFPHEGRLLSYTVVRDITKRKKEMKLRKIAEEKLIDAVEYNKLTTEFFANLSHEFRTPLNIILATVQLMNTQINNKDIDIDSKMKKYIKTMRQNCYRLLRLINNMIDITKIDSDFYRLRKENLNIVGLIEDITTSVVNYMSNRNIKFVFDTDKEVINTAVDSDAMERIILNLLSNAIKFTNEGDKIEVKITKQDREVIISVKDTGIGINEEKKGIIFDRLGQADKSLTRKQEGSGVGLSIVKGLVELHDGEITVESEYNNWTKFVIRLPITSLKQTGIKKDVYENRVEKINIEFSDIYL
ncbi:MAG: PAS domain S-box protein [Firmicutes bacterium]|nr:PAS domain S-box protein [Bacillota bacterium]